MASYTKNAIKETFMKLLDERPLNSISVKDIVKACGINRNSFYYHFEDLPSLIDELMTDEADKVIRKYASSKSFMECYEAVMTFLRRKKRTVMHVYRYVDRAIFESYALKSSRYFVQSYADTAFADRDIPAQRKELIIRILSCLLVGMMLEWFEGGMKEEAVPVMREIIENSLALLPGKPSETLPPPGSRT